MSLTIESLKQERDTLYEQLMKMTSRLCEAKDEISNMKKSHVQMSSSKPTMKTVFSDWEEVYSVQDVPESLWTANLPFDWSNTKFYKTNTNRGIERGYFVHKIAGGVCRVRRSLYQEWIAEKLDNTILEYEPANESAGILTARCRLIEVVNLTETREIVDKHILWGNAIEIVKNLRDGLGRAGDASYKDLCLGGILQSFAYIDKYLDLLPQDSCPTFKELLQDLVKKHLDGESSESESEESGSE